MAQLKFDPKTKSPPDFLEDVTESAEKPSGYNAQQKIDSLLYTKLPPHLKRPLNLPYLEKSTYDQIIAHLEKELDFSGLGNYGELSIPPMTAVPPIDIQQNTKQSKIVRQNCKQTRQRY